eukprot:7435645-Pyramimonas_sp.AAC.1
MSVNLGTSRDTRVPSRQILREKRVSTRPVKTRISSQDSRWLGSCSHRWMASPAGQVHTDG